MRKLIISDVRGREILDSRGNPTVEAEVILCDGSIGRGASPSGASTGIFEAVELRDEDNRRYCGKGTLNAVNSINTVIKDAICGMDALKQKEIDKKMIEEDGTENKGVLGANAILAVSLATARAAAQALDVPLFRYIGGINASKMPIPMMNILNGGAHAGNTVDTQEFMIMPFGEISFSERLRRCAEVFHKLAEILKGRGYATSVGDEGGFAPNLPNDEKTIEVILDAIKGVGYEPGRDFKIALDAAASEWKTETKGIYFLPKKEIKLTTDELISHWQRLCSDYPIYSIEDPLDEEDWDGWQKITEKLGKKVQLVGDDLFVTNTKRLKKGIDMKCANAILIKLNQIGTVTETMNAVKMAKQAGYGTIISHRSGETEDPFIADMAVGLNAGQIKTGAPNRSERVAKYNELLRIEELD